MPDKNVTITLIKPYPAQQVILDNAKRNNLLILSRRWGKTTLTSRILKHQALVKENFRGAYSAPTWKLMIEAFEECKRTLEPAITRTSQQDRRIELYNGSVIEFWSSDDPQSGRGRKYHLWVADEMQRQRDPAKFIKGTVRPTLADFRGVLWVMGTANGEGSAFHEFFLECIDDDAWFVAQGSLEQNPYIHPEEIIQMRKDLGPELAAQELDSLWVKVDGITPLVRKMVWDELYGIADNTSQQRKTGAIDASVSGDSTAFVATWEQDGHYYTDYDDIQMFEPDLVTKEIDYAHLQNVLFNRWQTGKYAAFAYDPYQMVSLAQRLTALGVRMIPFTQNTMRLKADGFLRQVINEGRYHHPDHDLLTEHVLNATLKYSSDGFRMIKGHKKAKIDIAVAASMALYIHNTETVQKFSEFVPMAADNFYQARVGQSAIKNLPQSPFTGIRAKAGDIRIL